VNSLKGGPAVRHRNNLAARGAQALFENRFVLGSDQENFAEIRYSLGIR
jgi:hypothetical protein